jgi:hypothetical protein
MHKYMKLPMPKVTAFLLFFAPLSALAVAPNDIQFKLLVDARTQQQGRFAKAQQAIGLDPTKAPHEAHAALEAFCKDLTKLRDESVTVLNARYQYWNNQAYWRTFWDKGPSAKFVVEKLRVQIDAANSLKIPMDAPFTKPDLNTMQKALDAVRASFELDRQLTLMEVQLNNLPKR